MDKLIIILSLLTFSGFIMNVDSKTCKVKNRGRWIYCHCYTNAMACNGVRILSLKHLKIPHDVKVVNLKYNHIKEIDMEFIRNNPNVEVLDIRAQNGFNCNSLEFVENVTDVNIISDCVMDTTTATETTIETEDDDNTNSTTTTVKTYTKHTHKMKTEGKKRQTLTLTLTNPNTTRRPKTISTTPMKTKTVSSYSTTVLLTTTKTTTTTTTTQPKLQTVKIRPPIKIHPSPSSTSTSTQSTKEVITTPELTTEGTTTMIIETLHIRSFIAIIIVTTLFVTGGIIIIVTCVTVVKRKCICNKCDRVKVRCCCIEDVHYNPIRMAAIPMAAFPMEMDNFEQEQEEVTVFDDLQTDESGAVVSVETLYSDVIANFKKRR